MCLLWIAYIHIQGTQYRIESRWNQVELGRLIFFLPRDVCATCMHSAVYAIGLCPFDSQAGVLLKRVN